MDELTTARILREDQQQIEEQFGKPMHKALHKLLLSRSAQCEHPEDKRTYETMTLNANHPGQALNQRDGVRILNGFYCAECDRHIFPDQGSGS